MATARRTTHRSAAGSKRSETAVKGPEKAAGKTARREAAEKR